MKRIALLLCLGTTFASSDMRAGILVTINVSNPSAVSFTATGANADINDSIDLFLGGVTFKDFFSSPTGVNFINAGTGTGSFSGDGTSLSSLLTTDRDGTTYFDALDINLSSASSTTASFSTGSPAFTGASTFDLSAVSSYLRTSGSGDIALGYGQNSHPLHSLAIGQWQVVTAVPEPASVAFVAGVALGAFALVRRRSLQADASVMPVT